MKKMLASKALIAGAALLFASFSTDPFTSVEKPSAQDVSYINGSKVVFTQVVHLDTESEVLPVDSDAKGIAILRMTEDRMLYSKVMVHKVEDDDGEVFAAHIHTGAEGVAGPILVNLVTRTFSGFGENTAQRLEEPQYNSILNEQLHLYVNAHSTVYPAGIVRGQIR